MIASSSQLAVDSSTYRLQDTSPPPAYAQAVQQSGESCFRTISQQISPLPDALRKSILLRLIRTHNESTFKDTDKIALPVQSDFQASFPKLHQWIEQKLGAISFGQTGSFAFASGHFAAFKQAKDRFPADLTKVAGEFFHHYFLKEGTDQGIQRLRYLMQWCEILYPKELEKLDIALNDLDLEPVAASHDASPPPDASFPYVAVFSTIAGKMRDWQGLAYRLGTDFDKVETIRAQYPGCNSVAMMDYLHDFACNGGDVQELVTTLAECGRVDLSQKLKQATLGTSSQRN